MKNLKTNLILFLILSSSILSNAQEVEIDGFSFDYKKTVTNSKNFEGHSSPSIIMTGPGAKKIQNRFRIKSLSGKRENFDPNKFYLTSDDNKLRFRPVDMKYNYVVHAYYGFGYLSTVKVEKKGVPVSYKPEIRDTFKDYQIADYKDVDSNINFGTKNKPVLSCIYFDNKEIRSNVVDVYFAIPESLNNVALYYGDVKIKDIILD